jgi:hypothetical protein
MNRVIGAVVACAALAMPQLSAQSAQIPNLAGIWNRKGPIPGRPPNVSPVTLELYVYSDPAIKYGFLLRVTKADGKVWNSPLDIGRRGQREEAERGK